MILGLYSESSLLGSLGTNFDTTLVQSFLAILETLYIVKLSFSFYFLD